MSEGPQRPLVKVDAFEKTPSQYLNLPSKTLEQKCFNTIFNNQGIGYSRMLPDMQINGLLLPHQANQHILNCIVVKTVDMFSSRSATKPPTNIDQQSSYFAV